MAEKKRTHWTPSSIRFVGPRAHQNQLRYMMSDEYDKFILRGDRGTHVGTTGRLRIDERPATEEEMRKKREKLRKYLGKGNPKA